MRQMPGKMRQVPGKILLAQPQTASLAAAAAFAAAALAAAATAAATAADVVHQHLRAPGNRRGLLVVR